MSPNLFLLRRYINMYLNEKCRANHFVFVFFAFGRFFFCKNSSLRTRQFNKDYGPWTETIIYINFPTGVTCHVSCVKRHLSHVTGHLSHVMFHFYLTFVFNKVVELFGGGSFLNGAYLVQFQNMKNKSSEMTKLR